MPLSPECTTAFVQNVSYVGNRSRTIGSLRCLQCSLFVGSGDQHHSSRRRRQTGFNVIMSTPMSRRQFAQISLTCAVLGAIDAPPASAEGLPSLFAAPENLISRVAKKAPPRPIAKLFEEDVFYPDYFAGVWDTESKLISVSCPAGYKLFGRPGTFENAQHEINKSLKYSSRFVRSGKSVISDRLFNVKAIAEASMGPQSVLDCRLPNDNPNRLSATIRPNSEEGEVFIVSLKALARQQQEGPLPRAIGDPDVRPAFIAEPNEAESLATGVDGVGLYTSEMVRQEVRPETEDLRVMPSIKEVETTTLFITKPMDENCIEAWQKTSSYLTRSSLQYVDAHGLPIDVRWYKVKYTRKIARE